MNDSKVKLTAFDRMLNDSGANVTAETVRNNRIFGGLVILVLLLMVLLPNLQYLFEKKNNDQKLRDMERKEMYVIEQVKNTYCNESLSTEEKVDSIYSFVVRLSLEL